MIGLCLQPGSTLNGYKIIYLMSNLCGLLT